MRVLMCVDMARPNPRRHNLTYLRARLFVNRQFPAPHSLHQIAHRGRQLARGVQHTHPLHHHQVNAHVQTRHRPG